MKEIEMGTRAQTIVYHESWINSKTDDFMFITGNKDSRICSIYRQMDGYPDCHGRILVDFLSRTELGYNRINPNINNQANGMECLAAQLVALLKYGGDVHLAGSIYLSPPSWELGSDIEYLYEVYTKEDNEIYLRGTSIYGKKVLFNDIVKNITIKEKYYEDK